MQEDIFFIPLRWAGPLSLHFIEQTSEELSVPLATFESPLWPSVNRGARVSRQSGGIYCTVLREQMSRSILLEAENGREIHKLIQWLTQREEEGKRCIERKSRFLSEIRFTTHPVGRTLFVRLEAATGDASGHNMITVAAEALSRWICSHHAHIRPLSVSGNCCVDKKVSAINGCLGRGREVQAEILISRKVCESTLRTTVEKMVSLTFKKNWMGSTLAGSVRSANAHFANMILAFYLATGQDGANVVEGSQGFTCAEKEGEDLYFSVTLPHLIVGSVGNGKELPAIQSHLRQLDCLQKRAVGENARRLAQIAAATVLCGELSLLAALTNEGELLRTHLALERKR